MFPRDPVRNAPQIIADLRAIFPPAQNRFLFGPFIKLGWGTPSIITPDMVKPGAAVVSAGITMDGRRVVPDVDEAVGEVAGWITPRLGGVGPTTIAMLLTNTIDAAERRASS